MLVLVVWVVDGISQVDKRKLEAELAFCAHRQVLENEPDAQCVGEVVELEGRGDKGANEVAGVGGRSGGHGGCEHVWGRLDVGGGVLELLVMLGRVVVLEICWMLVVEVGGSRVAEGCCGSSGLAGGVD